MDVTPLVREGTQIIQSYKGGAFRVSNVQHAGAIIVTPEQTRAWDVEPADLSVDDFSVIEADVILLGTGARLVHLAPELRKALRAAGKNIEVMDTGAACRTYNVLMAEGRSVAAALIPIGGF
jgi:uncharacterized protein